MGLLQISRIYSMNNKILKALFVVFAMFALLAVLYHSLGVFFYFTNTDLQIFGTDRSPVWRHALFICIGISCFYGLLKRPAWFVCFFGVLTLQQLYSHGSYALYLWQSEHQIHRISIAVIVFMPILFILLLLDQRSKR